MPGSSHRPPPHIKALGFKDDKCHQGHGVKGEFDLLLPLLSLLVTVPWTNPESAFSRRRVMGDHFLGARGGLNLSSPPNTSGKLLGDLPPDVQGEGGPGTPWRCCKGPVRDPTGPS